MWKVSFLSKNGFCPGSILMGAEENTQMSSLTPFLTPLWLDYGPLSSHITISTAYLQGQWKAQTTRSKPFTKQPTDIAIRSSSNSKFSQCIKPERMHLPDEPKFLQFLFGFSSSVVQCCLPSVADLRTYMVSCYTAIITVSLVVHRSQASVLRRFMALPLAEAGKKAQLP